MAPGERAGAGSADPLEVDRAIRHAEETSRFEFSVFVGATEGDAPRAFAERLHGSLVAPARSILIMVDPTLRAVEVVTGEQVRRSLTDTEVGVALGHMRTHFADGDLTAGLVRGILLLAEHARAPRTLHAD